MTIIHRNLTTVFHVYLDSRFKGGTDNDGVDIVQKNHMDDALIF